MAEVWYAENKIGKNAAVKMLLPKLCQDENVVSRFLTEAKVMVELNHPNIRQVYDYGDIDGRPAIVMEYLDGTDLKAKLKSGQRFTDEELKRWWNQLVSALNYTHQQGVVHRDIKPGNTFVDKMGNIKLLDFGIAKVRDSISKTQTGQKLGTLMYMSPEQVKDSKHIDYRTDVYSLAVTFVHLITGKKPYDSDTSSDFEISEQIVYKPLDMSGLPVMWRNFLTPYLEKKPEDRPALRPFAATPETPKGIDHNDDDETLVDTGRGTAGHETPSGRTPTDKPSAKTPHSGPAPLSPTPKDKPKSKKGLRIGIGVAVAAVALVAVLLLCRDPYKKIDRWLSESEQYYAACHIDSLKEDYASAVDSLNRGYASCVKAMQALEEMKNPNPQVFALRKQRCDSLDSLYVLGMANIIELELIRSSISDDTLAAIARLRQLEKSHLISRDSVERDIDLLYHSELFYFYKKDKDRSGYIDQSGNIVIQPQFESVDGFSEGLCAVKLNGKYGYINKLGIMVIHPQYNSVYGFHEGIASVKINEQWGFIDKSGNMVISPQYDDALFFSEGLASVKMKEKWGFIEKSGNWVISPRYDRARYFKQGLAEVQQNGMYGLIDRSGNYRVKTQYDFIGDYFCWISDGMARIEKDGKYGFLDADGKMIVEPQYEYADCFSEGLAVVKKNGKYGYLDKSGNIVIQLQYEYAGSFHEGLALIKKNGKYGYIGWSGNIAIQLQYENAWSFHEGIARVTVNGKYGFIDRSGSMIIEPQFDDAYSFDRGLARVKYDGKSRYIDKQGNTVFEY